MDAQVVSLGASWFRTFTLAFADGYGNLALEIDGLPEDKPMVNLRNIFPAHVIQELLNCEICYSSADDTRRHVCAFREWLRPSGNPRCEPCLSVKLSRERDAIILFRNGRVRVPEWCDRIRLLRAEDSLELLDLPLIRIVSAASHK